MCKYIDELKKNNYKKSSIKSIANKYDLTESELKRYYQSKFFDDIANVINLNELSIAKISNLGRPQLSM
mgnify:CR=1 FL=1